MKGKRLEEYMSPREVASRLGVSRKRVLKLIQDERIRPVYHVDGVYLVPVETVEKFERIERPAPWGLTKKIN